MNRRIGLFVDVSNLYYCLMKTYNGSKLDYGKFYNLISQRGDIVRSFAYGAHIDNQADKFLRYLRQLGFTIQYKKPKEFTNFNNPVNLESFQEIINLGDRLNFDPNLLKSSRESLEQLKEIVKIKKIRKADWDVGLTIDIVKLIDRLDTIVIGSADGDLAPLISWAKEKGCYVMVYACNISRELKDVADEFIEIDETLLTND